MGVGEVVLIVIGTIVGLAVVVGLLAKGLYALVGSMYRD